MSLKAGKRQCYSFSKKEQKSAFINFYKGNKLQKMKQRNFLCNQYFLSLLKVNRLKRVVFETLTHLSTMDTGHPVPFKEFHATVYRVEWFVIIY